ncbi:MAG: carboxypeptidase-like regulatory domain-containing protein [Saprospiraceae bacterium]
MDFDRIISKILISFLLVLNVSVCIIGQSGYVTGRISDEKDKAPLPYAHIYVKGKPIGVYSNEVGKFKLRHLTLGDTFIVTSIGYQEKEIRYEQESIGEILLNPKSYELVSAEIRTGNPKDYEYGFMTDRINTKKISGVAYGIGVEQKEEKLILTNYQMAVQIRNEKNLSGTIKSVEIYLHEAGVEWAPFRLRLYNCKESNTPGDDLINENIILSGEKGDWIKVDLEKYYLELPERGFFISIEWLPTSDKEYWYPIDKKLQLSKKVWRKWKKVFKANTESTLGYGHMIGVYDSASKNEVWRKSVNKEWEKKYFEYSPMIKCKVRIWE